MGLVMRDLLRIENENDAKLISEFIFLATRTVEYAQMAGCRLLPFAGSTLPHFRVLSSFDKVKVISGMRIFNEICEQVLSDGKSLADSRMLTWYALKKFQFHFPSDLLEYISDDNVVEVYDRNNVQIFRNFHFFEVTSYTLEDLLCRTWVSLFLRKNTDHTKSTINICEKFYTKEITSVTSLGHIGKHSIVESDSPFSFTVDAVIDYLAPLYDKSKFPAGVIAIETADLTCKVPQGEEAEALLEKYYRKDLDFL